MSSGSGGGGVRSTGAVLRPALLLSLPLLAFLAFPAGAAPPACHVTPVDERGLEVAGPLRLCVTRGLATDCRDVRGGFDLVAGEPFERLTVEGPEHGPASAGPEDLAPANDGRCRLVVPRKTRLLIRHLPSPPDRLHVSLYAAADPVFRQPRLREHLKADRRAEARLFIPAGRHLLSLVSRGSAPDLHLVDGEPGGSLVVDYTQRTGWSLLVRDRDRATGKLLAGTRVRLAPAPGYRRGPGGERLATTDDRGLTVISGITDSLTTAALEHTGYVPAEVPGVVAAPGTFAFREVELDRGGSVAVEVTVDGEPADGASCHLLRVRAQNRPGHQNRADLLAAEGETDGNGRWRRGTLPEGDYSLQVVPRGANREEGTSSQNLHVDSGLETPVAVELERLPVSGQVLRGDRPATGFRVSIGDATARRSFYTSAGVVARNLATDEDGRFHAVLWRAGDYSFSLKTADGTPAAPLVETIDRPRDDIDFHLAAADLAGVVVDDRGRPVAGAAVVLRWQGHQYRLAVSAEDGSFAFPLDDVAGSATVRAQRLGFANSREVGLEVVPDAAPPPIVLKLERRDDILAARLRTGSGAPAPGAWVASFNAAPGGAPQPLGSARTGPEGVVVVPRAPGGASLLFATGGGCPLSIFHVAQPADPDEGPLELACPAVPASVGLTLLLPDGRPVPDVRIVLERGADVIPKEVLAAHESSLGLPAETDGSGHLELAGLEPGHYTLFLALAANEATIAGGQNRGYLASVELPPAAAEELRVTVKE